MLKQSTTAAAAGGLIVSFDRKGAVHFYRIVAWVRPIFVNLFAFHIIYTTRARIRKRPESDEFFVF